jgi:hypothetical protein
MDWSHKRRLWVWIVIGSVIVGAGLILAFAIFYKTPTCTDGKQNGDETGIDCGGSCSRVCTAQALPARVRFSRVLQQSGRSDLIAYIDNTNQDAYAHEAPVNMDVYLQNGHALNRHLLVTLPAKSTTPIFIAGISQNPVQQAFASIVPEQVIWTKGSGLSQSLPTVSSIVVQNADSHPIVTATVANPTAYPQTNVPLVATIFSSDGTAIAASQTVVRLLPPQGTAQIVFTWNEPFSAPYARVEILPVVALPALLP